MRANNSSETPLGPRDRYADCEVCGERFWNADIDRWTREVERDGEAITVCIDKHTDG